MATDCCIEPFIGQHNKEVLIIEGKYKGRFGTACNEDIVTDMYELEVKGCGESNFFWFNKGSFITLNDFCKQKSMRTHAANTRKGYYQIIEMLNDAMEYEQVIHGAIVTFRKNAKKALQEAHNVRAV